jgi:hypothetical protein
MCRGHDEYKSKRPHKRSCTSSIASNKGTSKSKVEGKAEANLPTTREWRVQGLGEPAQAINALVRAQASF